MGISRSGAVWQESNSLGIARICRGGNLRLLEGIIRTILPNKIYRLLS